MQSANIPLKTKDGSRPSSIHANKLDPAAQTTAQPLDEPAKVVLAEDERTENQGTPSLERPHANGANAQEGIIADISVGDMEVGPPTDEEELVSIDALVRILERDTDEQVRLTKEDILQLKREAEKGQSKNVVMELSLDMDDDILILYLSPSWSELLG
jgi:hypothetical protein